MAVFYLAGLYVSAVIGAGFATGYELVYFFVRYGRSGLLGVGTAIAVLTVGSFLVLEECQLLTVDTYEGLFKALKIRGISLLSWLYTVFLLIGLSVMLAGTAELGAGSFQRVVLRYGTALLVAAALREGVNGVLRVGGWLAPIIVIVLLVLTVPSLGYFREIPVRAVAREGIEAGFLYGAYNFSFAMTVLAGAHGVLKGKRERIAAVLVGNMALAVCLVVGVLGLAAAGRGGVRGDIPFLAVAWARGPLLVKIYRVILWSSMYTTALANAYALVQKEKGSQNGWASAPVVVPLLGLALSYVGFGNLVRIAYPLLGLAGLYLLAHLIRARFCRF